MRVSIVCCSSVVSEAQPFRLSVSRAELLESLRTAPAQAQAEFTALLRLYGEAAHAEWQGCAQELEDAARLLRMEPDCTDLVLELAEDAAGCRTLVYDAE